MKKRVNLGRVIAKRVLIASETGRRVTLSIGTPQYIGDGWDWVCPYRINGIGKPLSGHVHGIDALQTLQLVSTGLRGALESTRRKFTFLGDSFWQSGFPKQLGDLGVQDLARRLEKLMIREQTRWVTKNKAGRGKARSRRKQ